MFILQTIHKNIPRKGEMLVVFHDDVEDEIRNVQLRREDINTEDETLIEAKARDILNSKVQEETPNAQT